MKAVWVVEKGEYSDYRVCGVFSSKENAERIAGLINEREASEYYRASVAEWPMDPMIEQVNSGLLQFEVWMLRSGDVEKIFSDEDFSANFEERVEVFGTWSPQLQVYDEPFRLRAWLWAKDAEHAVKITNERRTQLIANNEWPTPVSPPPPTLP